MRDFIDLPAGFVLGDATALNILTTGLTGKER